MIHWLSRALRHFRFLGTPRGGGTPRAYPRGPKSVEGSKRAPLHHLCTGKVSAPATTADVQTRARVTSKTEQPKLSINKCSVKLSRLQMCAPTANQTSFFSIIAKRAATCVAMSRRIAPKGLTIRGSLSKPTVGSFLLRLAGTSSGTNVNPRPTRRGNAGTIAT